MFTSGEVQVRKIKQCEKECQATFGEIIKKAEEQMSKKEVSQLHPATFSSSQWDIFCPQNNLAPGFLEKAATHLKVTQFCSCLKVYIETSFRGAPSNNCWMFIQPLLAPTWWYVLENKGIKPKTSRRNN